MLLEGQAMIEAALAGWWEVPGVIQAEDHPWEIPLWSGLEVQRLPQAELAALGNPERHGGVIALAKQPQETAEVGAYVKKVLAADALLVVCPRATDAAGAGELVRLAAGAGAAAVLFGVEGASPFEPDAVAASAGDVFKLPVKVADAGLILRSLMAGKVHLVGLGGSDAAPIKAPEGRRAVVVPGQEGLDAFWKRVCDQLTSASLAVALEALVVKEDK